MSDLVFLHRPADGLVARLALIERAQSTIDAQYYEWHRDAVGYIVTNRLLAAAERGVAVRMLVDDIDLERSTHTVASLCLHPNLEIRVFNPWSIRSNQAVRMMEFVARFGKLDHRMHNKLLIADNEQAVFGGRNLGEEYFGLSEDYNFVDFDVWHGGTVIDDLSSAFETYWQSSAAVPGASLDPSVTSADLEATRSRLADELSRRTPTLATVLEEEGGWDDQAQSLAQPVADDSLQVTVDSPEVLMGEAPTQVYRTLRSAFENAEKEVLAVAPFFVPSHVEWYRNMVDRGVRLSILTNSLASNPVTISNSGLRPHRAGIVKAGVELHELRTDAKDKAEWETPPRRGRRLSLHGKMYVIDRKRFVFGSVNLDPRSKFINTEMAVSIEDRAVAEDRAQAILRLMEPGNSWSVGLEKGGLVWRSDTETLHRQPAESWKQRAADAVFSRFPIGNQV